MKQRGHRPSAEKETVSASDEDAIADVMEHHDQFVGSMQSRLAKLQVLIDNCHDLNSYLHLSF